MPVEVVLQKRELGYQASKPLIDKLLELIEKKREGDVFSEYVELSKNILAVDEEVAGRLRRKRRCADATIELKSGCYELLDTIIQSIKSRFTENDDILRCLSAQIGEMTIERKLKANEADLRNSQRKRVECSKELSSGQKYKRSNWCSF